MSLLSVIDFSSTHYDVTGGEQRREVRFRQGGRVQDIRDNRQGAGDRLVERGRLQTRQYQGRHQVEGGGVSLPVKNRRSG